MQSSEKYTVDVYEQEIELMLKNKPYQYSFIWDGIYIDQMLLRIHFEIAFI